MSIIHLSYSLQPNPTAFMRTNGTNKLLLEPPANHGACVSRVEAEGKGG